MPNPREIVVAEIESMLADTGLTASALAREAGLATSTLTRFLAEENASLLTMRTMIKLREARAAIVARRAASPSLQDLLKQADKGALIAELLAVPEADLRAALDTVKRRGEAGGTRRKAKKSA